jgi:hypothetical protein
MLDDVADVNFGSIAVLVGPFRQGRLKSLI